MTCYIVSIVVAVAVLTLSVTWWLASFAVAAAREQAEKALQQEASEISTFIDREIVSAHNLLTALASSPHLQERNFEALYSQVSAVANKVGSQLVLRDNRTNSQVINTARPWPDKLVGHIVGSPSVAEAETLKAGNVAVSNLFWGPQIKKYVTAVLIPISGPNEQSVGELDYTLSIGIPTDRFHQILLDSNPGDDRVFSIVDRNGVIVARSHRNSDFVGKSIRSVDPEHLKTRPARGIIKDRNIEGVDYCWGYVRSKLTGWTVVSGVPESTLRADAYSTTMRFILAGSGIMLVAVGGALGLGARISRTAGALGIDRPPTLDEFNVLFESAPNGVLLIDGAGSIVLVNKEIERIFGRARNTLIGEPTELLLPERFRNLHSSLRRDYAKSPRPQSMGAGKELYGLRLDGTEVPVEISLSPIATRTGQLIMATIFDVTARKSADEALVALQIERNDLRRRFLSAQEEERLRLARDLHDQTGQLLVAAMLDLRNIEPHVDASGHPRTHALRDKLENVSKTLHQVAHELRPASIDDLGLFTALADYIEEWRERFILPVDFHCRGCPEQLSEELRTAIYRIVQEALNNVAKHATGASTVSVILDVSEQTLRLTVADDGAGFVAETTEAQHAKRRRLGLAGMRERVVLFGGDFDVETSSSGTAVCVRIPTGTNAPAP